MVYWCCSWFSSAFSSSCLCSCPRLCVSCPTQHSLSVSWSADTCQAPRASPRTPSDRMDVRDALTHSLSSLRQLFSSAVTRCSASWEVTSCRQRSAASWSRVRTFCLRDSASRLRAATRSSRSSSWREKETIFNKQNLASLLTLSDQIK